MSGKKLTRKEKFASTNSSTSSVEKQYAKISNSNYKWYALLLFILATIAYLNTLGFKYALDDYSIILENGSTKKGFSAIKVFFTTTHRYGYIFTSDELYRPLSKLLLATEWELAPNNPMVGHFVNIVLYSSIAGLLFNFLMQITKNKVWFSFFSTALFIVHPLHTEVVANIKSVDELLGFLFGLLSLSAAFRYYSSNKFSDLMKCAFYMLLALFSKESSITLLAVLPLLAYYFTDGMNLKKWNPFFASLVVAIIFLLVRSSVVGQSALSLKPSFVDNMLASAKGVQYYTTAIYIVGLYLLRAIIPYPLSFDNSYPQLPYVGFMDWQFILSAIVIVVLIVLAISQFRSRTIFSFGAFFLLITFSVSSNLVVTIGTHWGERLFFVPVLGCILIVISLLDKYIFKSSDDPLVLKNYSHPSVLILSFISVIFLGMTISRNSVWANNSTLYHSGLKSAPNSTRVQFYLGNSLIKEDQLIGKSKEEQDSILNLGISYLKRSTELTPSFTDSWTQLGVAYSRLKKDSIALSMYNTGLKYNPNDPTVYNNIGTIYFGQKDYQKAFENFNKAVELNPSYVDALMNLGSIYGTANNYDQAITSFETALQYDPTNARAYYFIGLTYKFKGNEQLSKQNLEKAYSLDPTLRK
jgi:tetratricopeptide (TPR) repeat protein